MTLMSSYPFTLSLWWFYTRVAQTHVLKMAARSERRWAEGMRLLLCLVSEQVNAPAAVRVRWMPLPACTSISRTYVYARIIPFVLRHACLCARFAVFWSGHVPYAYKPSEIVTRSVHPMPAIVFVSVCFGDLVCSGRAQNEGGYMYRLQCSKQTPQKSEGR